MAAISRIIINLPLGARTDIDHFVDVNEMVQYLIAAFIIALFLMRMNTFT